MMARRALRITVTLDFETVTCPGVWLCPRGRAYLQVRMLDRVHRTKEVSPAFPLQFYERFQYQQTVCKAWTVEQLREYLASTCIHAELVQVTSQSNLLVLATFRTSVADLLYPIEDEIGVCIQRPVSLLMDATDRFPGTINPKIEVGTALVIDEMINYPLRGDSWILDPKHLQIGTNASTKPRTKGRFHQTPVCHSDRSVERCDSCKPSTTNKKYHIRIKSPLKSPRRRSNSMEKENLPQRFSTSTFTGHAEDPGNLGSLNFCQAQECGLCANYERKMEALHRRGSSISKSKYHSMPTQKYSTAPSPHQSGVYESNNIRSDLHGSYAKLRSTSSAKLTNPPKNGRHYHSKNIDPSELKAARERIQTSIMNLAEAVSKNGSKRRVHSKTTDSQVCKDCSERFLNSVLPDELLRQGSPPKNHTTTREKTRRRKPKKNPAPPEPSKLKCCTNCYCITCNNCKHKVKLDESLCSMCKDKAAVSKKLENIPGY